jgi:hypothetical protein
MRSCRLLALGLSSVFFACQSGGAAAPDDDDGVTKTGGEASVGSSSDTAASGDSTTGGTAGEPGPSSPVLFDLGVLPDAAVVQDSGCRGIDFLFVIDNSGSMFDKQERLKASFDGFIAAIQASLQNVTSYHVGVVTTDNYVDNEAGCNSIGALVTQVYDSAAPTGTRACHPFAEGHRFATDKDDLSLKFPCIAEVGTSGGIDEQPLLAIESALDPAMAEPGACNEGFIRDDSILVIVILTDEDDQSPGELAGYYDAVVERKGGDPQAVVLINFHLISDLSCAPLGEPAASRLPMFTTLFGEQGVAGEVCAADYSPLFASTVETIQVTCENFTPAG